jgi:hypothetical protein
MITWHDLPPDYSRGTVNGRDRYLIQAVSLSHPAPFVGLETLLIGGSGGDRLLGYTKRMSDAKRIADDHERREHGEGAAEAPSSRADESGRRPWPRRAMEDVGAALAESAKEAGPGGALDWKQDGGNWTARAPGGGEYILTDEGNETKVWLHDRGQWTEIASRSSLGGAMQAAAKHVNRGAGYKSAAAPGRARPKSRAGEQAAKAPKSDKPVIRTTFSRTTPESVEQGDFSETGWIDEDGVDMTPEPDTDETVVDNAVRFLRYEGVIEASSSSFHRGIWYSTEWSTIDYRTGEEEERSYHLHGFTEEQEREVYERMFGSKRGAREAARRPSNAYRPPAKAKLAKLFVVEKIIPSSSAGRNGKYVVFTDGTEVTVHEGDGKGIVYALKPHWRDAAVQAELGPLNFDEATKQAAQYVALRAALGDKADRASFTVDHYGDVRAELHESGASEELDVSALGEVPRAAKEDVKIVHESPRETVSGREDFSSKGQAEMSAYLQGARFISGSGSSFHVYFPQAKGFSRRVLFKKQNNWHVGRRGTHVGRLPEGATAIDRRNETVAAEAPISNARAIMQPVLDKIDALIRGTGNERFALDAREFVEAAVVALENGNRYTAKSNLADAWSKLDHYRNPSDTQAIGMSSADSTHAHAAQRAIDDVVKQLELDRWRKIHENGASEELRKVHGKWAFVSKHTHRPLAYYRGSGKPSKAWVNKQERRVQYFKRHSKELSDTIRVGDRVTIVDRFGHEATGRAVMKGPYGWVLNMGGRYGTPAVASDENIVRVRHVRAREAFEKSVAEDMKKLREKQSKAFEAAKLKMIKGGKKGDDDRWMHWGDFKRNYAIALMWSTNDESTPQGGEPLDRNYGLQDLAPSTVAAIDDVCDKFQRDNKSLLEDAYARGQYSPTNAGFDLALTQNHHGTGFWDRTQLEKGDLGDKLTKAAHAMGEFQLYVGDDGKIYAFGYERAGRHARREGGGIRRRGAQGSWLRMVIEVWWMLREARR